MQTLAPRCGWRCLSRGSTGGRPHGDFVLGGATSLARPLRVRKLARLADGRAVQELKAESPTQQGISVKSEERYPFVFICTATTRPSTAQHCLRRGLLALASFCKTFAARRRRGAFRFVPALAHARPTARCLLPIFIFSSGGCHELPPNCILPNPHFSFIAACRFPTTISIRE